MHTTKIAIIGCGNLGSAILNGLLSNEKVKPENLTATRRNTKDLEHFRKKGVHITSDNAEAIRNSEIIIVGLKPYKIVQNLTKNKSVFKEDHIVISLATAISIEQIEKAIEANVQVFRAMPNTAAEVGVSMNCICTNTNNQKTIDKVIECFNSVGETIVINEELMDSATVLGACGIAYVLRFIRAMIQGGIEIGFDAKTASNIATQTVKGAAELLIQRNQHPEYEIDKVTTPKGCTIAGLNEMEHNGFSSALIKGILTSHNKI